MIDDRILVQVYEPDAAVEPAVDPGVAGFVVAPPEIVVRQDLVRLGDVQEPRARRLGVLGVLIRVEHQREPAVRALQDGEPIGSRRVVARQAEHRVQILRLERLRQRLRRAADFLAAAIVEGDVEIEIQKKNILNCLINSQGKVLLDEEPTDVEQINRIVKKRLSQNPLLIVSVKAHPKTAYSDYVRVIDQLKIANAKKISIANSN